MNQAKQTNFKPTFEYCQYGHYNGISLASEFPTADQAFYAPLASCDDVVY